MGDGNEYVHAGFDTQDYITEAPYLGALLTCKRDARKFFQKHKPLDRNCMLLDHVNRLVLESVRSIAITLRSKEYDKSTHLVTVTSLRADEGKSVFVALLASELTSQGFGVLVVDLQGKSDALEKMLGACCQYDLSEYISQSKSLVKVMACTGAGNLMLISNKREAQTRNSIAYHPKMAELLQDSTEVFDFVIYCKHCADLQQLGCCNDWRTSGIHDLNRDGRRKHTRADQWRCTRASGCGSPFDGRCDDRNAAFE